MIRLYTVLCIFSVGLTVFAQKNPESPAQYPSWFLTMPTASDIVYVVGYSPVYATFENSVNEAIDNARKQLSKAEEISVTGERLFEVIPGGQRIFRGELFDESFPEYEGSDISILDTVQVKNMVLVLASNREDTPFLRSSITPISQYAPQWVTDVSNLVGNLYAVGVSPLYFYEQNAWLNAERQARHQLAFSVATRMRHLFKGTEDQEFSVTASSTAVKLLNAQVVERWRNDMMVFVLMRAEGFRIINGN